MTSPGIDFTIGKGDILPWLVVTPQTAAGSTITPSGTITFVITNPDTGVSGTGTGTTELFTDTDSVVKLRYKWASADTANAGKFYGQFRDLYGSTDQESFPNSDGILFEVYDKPPGQIITNRDEYNGIRAYLGLEPVDLTDPSIQSLTFLPAAELVIRKAVNKMSVDTGGAVPTVTQIMAGTNPATDDDKLALKLAVATYIAYIFGPSATNAIDVSVTKHAGPIETTRDRGGIGAQWKDPMEIAFAQAGIYLSLITGWPDLTQNVMMLSGPTSSGATPNTFSGFWLR